MRLSHSLGVALAIAACNGGGSNDSPGSGAGSSGASSGSSGTTGTTGTTGTAVLLAAIVESRKNLTGLASAGA